MRFSYEESEHYPREKEFPILVEGGLRRTFGCVKVFSECFTYCKLPDFLPGKAFSVLVEAVVHCE